MASSSIFIYEIIKSFTEPVVTTIFNALREYQDDPTNYFNTELISEDELSCEYVLVNNIEEMFYNAEERIFETRIIPRAVVVHFGIHNNKLEIWSNRTYANRLVFTLSNLIKDITFRAIEISLSDIVQKLHLYKIKISKVCFEDFLFTEDIVGSFSVDLSSYGDAFSVIQKYQDKIARMTILINCNESVLKVGLTAKGAVTIYKSKDLVDVEAISLLHDIIFK